MNKNEIKSQAKQIMDDFLNALSDINVEEKYINERKISMREEGTVKSTFDKEDFKNRFLSNAPKISGDAILANKGDWVE
jgi:hypothetical protein